MLDPRRLLTFRAVAREGSFSRAAEALALSQPAVSQQVSALEKQLGTELLVRGRGGTVPTRAGALLLEHADALAARLDLAGTQIDALVAKTARTLRLGAFPSAIASIVPSALAAVRAAAPELEIAVEEGTQAGLVAGVQSGDLHVAACFQDAAIPRREHDGLRRVELAEEPMLAMLGADHRLAAKPAIHLRELAGEPWSAPSRDGLVANACRAAGFEPELVILTRDPLAGAALAAAGVCITIVPELTGRLGLPGVATPALRGQAPRRSLYALLPDSGAHPQADLVVGALRSAASG
jgi:DNA-binding transcriptional LysR family regulator